MRLQRGGRDELLPALADAAPDVAGPDDPTEDVAAWEAADGDPASDGDLARLVAGVDRARDTASTRAGNSVEAGEPARADGPALDVGSTHDDAPASAEATAAPTATARPAAPARRSSRARRTAPAAQLEPAGEAQGRAPERDAEPSSRTPPGLAPLVGDETVEPDPLAGGRPAGPRLAGLHLRTGLHALARAELEALASRGRLDEAALLDLAEVRWRTGDLAAAGEAADTLLVRGVEAPLALVIAAEAVAEAGRPTEARRLSSRALELVDGPLEPIFGGMHRALIWPVATPPEAADPAHRPRGRRPSAESDGAPSTASEAFAGGRAALARGDSARAALLLGVAMRLEPAFAEDVLRAVAGRDDQPLLAMVRGDALRLLGRETEALEAFDRARGRSSAAATQREERAGPGLFDDDPG